MFFMYVDTFKNPNIVDIADQIMLTKNNVLSSLWFWHVIMSNASNLIILMSLIGGYP